MGLQGCPLTIGVRVRSPICVRKPLRQLGQISVAVRTRQMAQTKLTDASLLTDALDDSLSPKINKPEPAKIQTAVTPNPLTESANKRFPARSTRNPKPSYVDGLVQGQAMVESP